VVNEEDIRVQEDQVLNARKKLQEALQSFFPVPVPPKTEDTQNQNGSSSIASSILKGQHQHQNKKLRTGTSPLHLIKS
jgi:hypothetical protein